MLDRAVTAYPDLPAASAMAPLTLGSVLTGAAREYGPSIGLEDIHVLRHAFRPGGHEEMQTPEDLDDPAKLLAYTRAQDFSSRRFIAEPPRYWVVFIADGSCRARLFGTFENHGELPVGRADTYRLFDLHPSSFLAPFAGRLVVEWDSPRAWQRRASSVADLPVLEWRNP